MQDLLEITREARARTPQGDESAIVYTSESLAPMPEEVSLSEAAARWGQHGYDDLILIATVDLCCTAEAFHALALALASLELHPRAEPLRLHLPHPRTEIPGMLLYSSGTSVRLAYADFSYEMTEVTFTPPDPHERWTYYPAHFYKAMTLSLLPRVTRCDWPGGTSKPRGHWDPNPYPDPPGASGVKGFGRGTPLMMSVFYEMSTPQGPNELALEASDLPFGVSQWSAELRLLRAGNGLWDPLDPNY